MSWGSPSRALSSLEKEVEKRIVGETSDCSYSDLARGTGMQTTGMHAYYTYLIGRAKRAHLVVQMARFFYILFIYVHRPTVSPDTVSLLNVSTRFYLGVHAVRNIAILYSRSPTMLKHSSICIVVRVARYRIVSKCFYALLFKRRRGEKYRNTVLPLAHNAEAFT